MMKLFYQRILYIERMCYVKMLLLSYFNYSDFKSYFCYGKSDFIRRTPSCLSGFTSHLFKQKVLLKYIYMLMPLGFNPASPKMRKYIYKISRKEEIKINKVNVINVLGILLILSALLYPAGYIKSFTTFILLYVIGMALIVTGRIMVKKKS